MPRGKERRPRARAGALLAAVVVAISACSGGPQTTATTGTQTIPTTGPSAPTTTLTSPTAAGEVPTAGSSTAPATTALPRTPQIMASGLDVPWSIAFLPDGSALITLRDKAALLHLRPGHAPTTLGKIPGVVPGGEGGLLGVAVSPTYAQDHRIFVYLTAAADNRVARLTYSGNTLSAPRVILSGIPKARNHNGGRLAFGPDGELYVTTGDAGNTARSQQRSSLGGKILRITQDGAPAPGNPFGASPVWTLGHRNVQGMAWDPDARMFASEFGQDTWDELNLIRPGKNYGWPVIEGRGNRPGLVDPLYEWPTDDASPSGMAIAAGAIYLAALRGESLWRVPLSHGVIGQPRRLLAGTYGRLRDVVLAPDGRLWILTSNTFRGTPRPGDDKVIALPLALLR